MKSKLILAALASAGLVAGAPAFGQGLGVKLGGQGHSRIGVGHGQGVGVGVQGRSRVGIGHDRIRVRSGVDTRTRARVDSQGPANANIRARTRADANSVLHDDLLPPNLVGLRAGLTVRNAAGVTVGTVRRIQTSADGSVRAVLIAGLDDSRRLIPLSPRSLSVDGDVVTTTAVRFNDDD
jgi:hypothetical protein